MFYNITVLTILNMDTIATYVCPNFAGYTFYLWGLHLILLFSEIIMLYHYLFEVGIFHLWFRLYTI